MEISALFEDGFAQEINRFDSISNSKEWNGRKVTIIKEDKLSPLCKVINSQTQTSSKMIVNQGDASIRGGVDEEHGVYIEGKVSISWGGGADAKPSDKGKPADNSEPKTK